MFSILENLEILEILEVLQRKDPFRNDPFFRSRNVFPEPKDREKSHSRSTALNTPHIHS